MNMMPQKAQLHAAEDHDFLAPQEDSTLYDVGS